MTAPDPAAMMAAVAQRRAELLAQCPPAPSTMPREAHLANPINVVELGPDGPTVLIVHGGIQGGLGGGPATFDQQRPLAGRGWRLRMVERPGFGGTASRGIDDMVADAEWIAEMLGDGAHLVGHSWGGAEALLAAARRPDAVRSLTLIEPSLFPIVMTDPDLRADPEMQAVAGRLAQLMLQSATPADYALNFARTVLGPADDAETAQRIAGLREDPAAAASVGAALLLSKMASPAAMRSAADMIAANGVPTLVISGGWSPFFDRIGEVVARFTGGRYLVVPAVNHMVQDVSGHDFNSALETFMRAA
jgi:pimeloyl-ACP methyl ester carboxylesterase